MLLKQSTARDVMVFLADSADHLTGKTGLTLTITASKNALAFASITPTVTERGNGWYAVSLTAAHTDTLGAFVLHATAAGADPADARWQVVPELPGLLTTAYDFAKGTVAVTESYNADGAAPTPVQALLVVMQMLTEMSISGTTMTVKKLDGSTTALTLTLNDGTTPTSVTRSG